MPRQHVHETEPLKVILVEDDPFFLEGICQLFPWAKWGFEVVGKAVNGQIGGELCEQLVPDIVITDITMPVQDGLELTQMIRSRFPQIKVVLLTSHANFSFAQQALQLRVDDYLLKNDLKLEEKLYEALDQKRREIVAERSEQGVKQELLGFVHENLDWVQSRFYLQLLGGHGDASNVWEQASKKRLAIQRGAIAYMEVECYFETIEVDLDGNSPVLRLKERMREMDRHVDVFERSPGRFGIIYNADSRIHADISMAQMQLTAGKLLTFLRVEMKVEACAYIAGILPSLEALSKGGAVCDRLRLLAFYEKKGEILNAYHIGENVPFRSEARKQMEQELEAAVSGMETPDKVMQALAVHMRSQRFNPEELRSWAAQWIKKKAEDAGVPQLKLEKQAAAASKLEELTDCLSQTLTLIQQPSQSALRWEIKTALTYTHECYHEQLSSSMVADYVGLSPSQFTREFKKAMRENYTDYLLRYRVEKAKELILTGNVKVYEIAEKVGISHTGHFSKIFQRYTGQTPKDFKNGKR
ncbi:response regulator transcription factor [Paenibacillus roseipurpureus]|uniref:Response regulator n=1 Tax=Paenibacillus roseopurpureus TaxID=2918901 RepID=A0AA96RJ44_9BACL|nr:response regulator [Paenibacillus sp. MBLB1832]WNR42904.1 response regulator [Paenibacillus sp. MBLB1832]